MCYHLKQIVCVSEKHGQTAKISDTAFLGEIVAIKDDRQICVRRFNRCTLFRVAVTELQWINLETEAYHVIPVTLPCFQCIASVTQPA